MRAAGALQSKGAPRCRRWLDSRTVTSNLEALLAHLMRTSHFGLNLWHRPEHSKHSKRRSLCVVLRVRVALLVFPDLTFCANFFHALFGIFCLYLVRVPTSLSLRTARTRAANADRQVRSRGGRPSTKTRRPIEGIESRREQASSLSARASTARILFPSRVSN